MASNKPKTIGWYLGLLNHWLGEHPYKAFTSTVMVGLLICGIVLAIILPGIRESQRAYKEAMSVNKGVEGRKVVIQGCHYFVWHERKYFDQEPEERLHHDPYCPNH